MNRLFILPPAAARMVHTTREPSTFGSQRLEVSRLHAVQSIVQPQQNPKRGASISSCEPLSVVCSMANFGELECTGRKFE